MYNTEMPTHAQLPSTDKLLRSTAIAVVTAGALLFTIVLPSEYGIDPTGVGIALNLTEMGELKMQHAEQAKADAAMDAANRANPPAVDTGSSTSTETTTVAPVVALVAPPTPPAPPGPERQSNILGTIGALIISPAATREQRQDEMTMVLQPDEGAEIKLTMVETWSKGRLRPSPGLSQKAVP
jgi:hypothetical protein